MNVLNKNRFGFLKVGFGTGLNAWLNVNLWRKQKSESLCFIHTKSNISLTEEYLFPKLDYGDLWTMALSIIRLNFSDCTKLRWDKGVIMSEYFNMKKEKTTLQDVVPLPPSDVVFLWRFFLHLANSRKCGLKKSLVKLLLKLKPRRNLHYLLAGDGQLRRDLKEWELRK